jgi:hypothetical protein
MGKRFWCGNLRESVHMENPGVGWRIFSGIDWIDLAEDWGR